MVDVTLGFGYGILSFKTLTIHESHRMALPKLSLNTNDCLVTIQHLLLRQEDKLEQTKANEEACLTQLQPTNMSYSGPASCPDQHTFPARKALYNGHSFMPNSADSHFLKSLNVLKQQ